MTEKYIPVADRKIPFSSNWSKLAAEEFTTIRKRKLPHIEESSARIISPCTVYNNAKNETFEVKCTKIEKLPLGQISTEILLKDTDSTTREEAIAKIQRFYRKPVTAETIFYIYYLEKEHYAKPCLKCGGYYPGDCSCGPRCQCDGCKTLRAMNDPANHIHDFSSTRGDIEPCWDVESKYFGWAMLVMECPCGETKLVPMYELEDL